MPLAIVDFGYQSCWIEGHVTDEDDIGRQIARILLVPDEYDLVCILPVGIAAHACKPADKLSFDQRAWFNSFGHSNDRLKKPTR